MSHPFSCEETIALVTQADGLESTASYLDLDTSNGGTDLVLTFSGATNGDFLDNNNIVYKIICELTLYPAKKI